MQPAFGGVADIHAGAFANRFKTLEDLDRFGAVAVRNLLVCHTERAVAYRPLASATTSTMVATRPVEVKRDAGFL